MFKIVFGSVSLIFIENSFPLARHRHVFVKQILFEMAEKHPVGFFRNVLNVIPLTRNSAICPYGVTFDKQLTHISSPVLTYSGPLNVIAKDNAHPLNLKKAYFLFNQFVIKKWVISLSLRFGFLKIMCIILVYIMKFYSM